jgi:MFS family permease
MTEQEQSAGSARWRSLIATGEFRALWAAQAISLLGDQLARVAVAWLVFSDTGSALLTALVYAITFLPWLLGGPLLGGIADRFGRRAVMVACNSLSSALVGLVALPFWPFPVLCGLIFLITLVEAPFLSARATLLAEVLPDDRYVLASAAGAVTAQAAQVLGFAGGGALAALLGARPALLIDAVSFATSALIVRAFVREREAPAAGDPVRWIPWFNRIRAGGRVVLTDSRLRRLVLLAWLAAFVVVPEALAVPYASMLRGGASAAGMLLASQPIGAVLGGLLLPRLLPPDRRDVMLAPLAATALAPLLLFALRPNLPLAIALLIVSGFGGAYQMLANATFVPLVPVAHRGQALGIVVAGLVAGQGVGIAVAGAVAEAVSPAFVIVGAGAAGLLVLTMVTSTTAR